MTDHRRPMAEYGETLPFLRSSDNGHRSSGLRHRTSDGSTDRFDGAQTSAELSRMPRPEHVEGLAEVLGRWTLAVRERLQT
jgi:hypothetical protein